MRKITIFLLGLLCCYEAMAQNADKKWAIEGQFGKSEYRGDLQNQYWKWDPFYGLGAIGVNKYLSKSFDLGGYFSLGKVGAKSEIGSFLGGRWDLNLLAKYKLNNGKILSENSIIAPYLAAGLGYADYYHAFGGDRSTFRTGVNMTIPLGAGIKVNLSKSVALQFQTLFNFNESDWNGDKRYDGKIDNYLKHTVGLVISFGAKKDADKDGISDKLDACPNTPLNVLVDEKGCPLDSDADGVADYLDKCPGTPNGAKVDANGCPLDSDRDGVADYLDKCNDTPANVKVDENGCPIDTDGDGVADYQDQCPTEKGKASTQGCPDKDNDGVADKADKCPEVAGPISNDGCPVVEKKGISNLLFGTSQSAITPEHEVVLGDVVTKMNANNNAKLTVKGFADSTGPDEFNQNLSEKRAKSVKAYLVKKKIAEKRISTSAYGEAQPVGDNNTEEGRIQNRRVELEIK